MTKVGPSILPRTERHQICPCCGRICGWLAWPLDPGKWPAPTLTCCICGSYSGVAASCSTCRARRGFKK